MERRLTLEPKTVSLEESSLPDLTSLQQAVELLSKWKHTFSSFFCFDLFCFDFLSFLFPITFFLFLFFFFFTFLRKLAENNWNIYYLFTIFFFCFSSSFLFISGQQDIFPKPQRTILINISRNPHVVFSFLFFFFPLSTSPFLLLFACIHRNDLQGTGQLRSLALFNFLSSFFYFLFFFFFSFQVNSQKFWQSR